MGRISEALEERNRSRHATPDDMEHYHRSRDKHGRYRLGNRLFDNPALMVAFNNFIRGFDGDLDAAIREFTKIHGYEEDGGNDE
jgi:hypothetical protein